MPTPTVVTNPLHAHRHWRGTPEHVDRPALTLGLAVQPDVLRDIAAMPGFRGRGLLARILYALPANTVGRRRIGPPPVPEPVTDAYHTNLHALVLSLADWNDPAVLPLTPAANTAVLDLEHTIEPRLHPDTGDLAHLTDWAAKWVGATTRLAGLLHLATHLHDGWARPITPTTIQAATRLGHYYLTHALAAFDHMGADPATAPAGAVLKVLIDKHLTEFTRRELHRRVHRQHPKAADVAAVLDTLTQHGWIRPRPDGRYELHPRAADYARRTGSTS